MSGSMAAFVHEPAAELRGSRDYVHSTDLYEELVRGAKAAGLVFAGPIDLRIRAKITRRPVYRFLSANATAGGTGPIVAQCSFRSGGTDWRVLIGESDDLVVARKPYDEGPVARCAVAEGATARLVGRTGMWPIEAVTALAVLLHKQMLPPLAGKRWMLGQLTLERALEPADAERLALSIDKVSGSAITRSTLTGHDGPLGGMLFVLGSG